MPPKNTNKVAEKTFSGEVVAVILAAAGVNIGTKEYAIMAKVDPSKSASGYEHFFRDIKARSKEISKKISDGDYGSITATPKSAAKGEGKKATPKRGRKAKGESEDDEEGAGSPTKKSKKEKESDSGSDADAPGEEVV